MAIQIPRPPGAAAAPFLGVAMGLVLELVLGLGPAGGALLSLSTGTVSVLGREREQPVLLRWNAPVLHGTP